VPPDVSVSLPALWATIVRRIAVDHLLNTPRINFDLEGTAFELGAARVIG